MPRGARHSEELKSKVVKCFQDRNSNGGKISYGEVAKRFMMSKYSVVSIVQKFKKTGSVTNKHGGIYITI